MKKLFYIFSIGLLGSLLTLSSCSDDDDDNGNNNNSGNGGGQASKPKMEFPQDPQGFATIGNDLTYQVKVSSASLNIDNVSIKASVKDTGATTYQNIPEHTETQDFSGNSKEETYTWKMPIEDENYNAFDSLKIEFTGADKGGQETTITKRVVVGALLDELIEGRDPLIDNEKAWPIFHRSKGSKFGLTLDYKTDQFGTTGQKGKADFFDNSRGLDTLSNEWVVNNETKLARPNSDNYTFESTTDGMAEALFAGGKGVDTLSNIAEGDIIVAKIRNKRFYALMKIDKVVNVSNTDNNETREANIQTLLKYKNKP